MIDLHIHTNYSDGTDSVTELLKKAEDKKLEIISITDHDKIDAYMELDDDPTLRNLFSGVIIPGCELKCYYKNIAIEVLAYGIDYKKLKIHKVDRKKVEQGHLKYMKKILDDLGLKYNNDNLYIDLNDPSKKYAAFVIGIEILKYPENEEIIKKIGDFTPTTFYRNHQCNPNSKFYINESIESIDINELIKRIHDAGGLAFLAHGYLYPFENKDNTIEEILRDTDIDGLECEYPLFSSEERKKAKDLAKKYNKYVSGGTDYHANTKPNISLATGIDNNMYISKEFISDWICKVNKI